MNNAEIQIDGIARACSHDFNFQFAMGELKRAAEIAVEPFTTYKPKIFIDGDKWCALYGEDLQNGVSGFGDSPNEAVCDFNKNWYAKLKVQVKNERKIQKYNK